MKKLITILLGAGIAAAGIYLYIVNQPTKIEHPLPLPVSGEVNAVHVAPFFYDGLPEEFAVVDVRTDEEYNKKHTNGTLHIPVQTFEDSDTPCEDVISKLPKDKKIIFICPFGPRAEEMYINLTDPVEDLGCGYKKDGLYFLRDQVKFNKNKLVIKQVNNSLH